MAAVHSTQRLKYHQVLHMRYKHAVVYQNNVTIWNSANEKLVTEVSLECYFKIRLQLRRLYSDFTRGSY